MNMLGKFLVTASVAVVAAGTAGATVVTTASTDAAALAGALAGEGVTVVSASLSGDATNGAGSFTGGLSAGVGFDEGIILATGDVANAAGPNNTGSISGDGASTTLEFDFTTTTGSVFFQYVFASEEYEEFVGTEFNDTFELLINGINVALIPGSGDAVAINNVNQDDNTEFYRSNVNAIFDIQYDGLTTVLTASAMGLSIGGINTATFSITDVGDEDFDSAVFIRADSLSIEPPDEVPAPAALGLLGLGLVGLGAVRRRRS